jgi:hypothetical protein
MSKSRRNSHIDEHIKGKSQRRHERTERLKEFEAAYVRKNKIPIITL